MISPPTPKYDLLRKSISYGAIPPLWSQKVSETAIHDDSRQIGAIYHPNTTQHSKNPSLCSNDPKIPQKLIRDPSVKFINNEQQ